MSMTQTLRPRLPVPRRGEPKLPVMVLLDEVLSASHTGDGVNSARMRNDMNASSLTAAHRREPHDDDPLRDLLRKAQSLRPVWERPELFHIAKSDLVRGIKGLIAAGGAPAAVTPTSTSAPPRITTVTAPTAAPVVIMLSSDRFARLLDLATRPGSGKRGRQDFQGKLAKWRDTLDAEQQSVMLDGDDLLWLRRQLAGFRRGGYQWHLHAIFRGAHPLLTNISAKPWPRRDWSQRRYRRKPKPVS
jgi:hypothetical protein